MGDILNAHKKLTSQSKCLWEGPSGKGPNGGVTFSLLSRFIVCRERFRIHVIEGLHPLERWHHRMGYGSMWHVCEEAHAGDTHHWEQKLQEHTEEQCRLFPFQREEITKWWNVCRVHFPIYIRFWEQHPDMTARKPLLSEQTFSVPYDLPSGRMVRLRGKWDSVDLVDTQRFSAEGGTNPSGIWLQENKVKGDIDEVLLRRQLTFDLQTMMYLSVLTQDIGIDSLEEAKQRYGLGKVPYAGSRTAVRGVRYNVIRRPLSGGKGTIVRKKGSKNVPAETEEEYYARLAAYIEEEPHTYFYRWNVVVLHNDLRRFQEQSLNPLLEQLCDWWDWISKGGSPFSPNDGCENSLDQSVRSYIHWRHPYGVYNPLDEGGSTDLDSYIDSGSRVGLQRMSTLFRELEN